MSQLTLFENNKGTMPKLIEILKKIDGWYSDRCTFSWNEKYMGNDRNLIQLKTKTKIEFLPTPDASIRGARKNQNGHQVTLQDVAAMQTPEALKIALDSSLLPTPTSSDQHYGTAKRSENFNRDCDLKHFVAYRNGKPTQLNPQFVEEMMGFPENWTSEPFLKKNK